MNSLRLTTILLLLLSFTIESNEIPRFANYFQDHMVLQRAPQKSIIWGYGDSNQLTTLRINNQIYTIRSHVKSINDVDQSIWSVTLDPVSDEGPFDIHVSQPLLNGTLVTITLYDILFDDVWICSGQSNMQMAVTDIFNGTEEIANAANYPKIRLLTVARNASSVPVEELLETYLNWSVASPKTIGGPPFTYMSAVCWLYGRMIHQALGDRPIGLIGTSWGGTEIELWMSPKALQKCNVTINDRIDFELNHPSFRAPPGLNHSDLYNTMIYPFTRMVIYGIIWYQGESNSVYNLGKYPCTFSTLIGGWRQTWNERTNGSTDIQFPFGFVQLSTAINNETFVGGFPWVRWHQTFDVGYVPNNVVPKVFMAVALDLRNDPNYIHPRYKHDVGYRLSRSGLAVAYNQSVEFQGPIVQNVSYYNGSQTINITYTAVQTIELRNPNGFQVCCLGRNCSSDARWIAANVTSKNNLIITVTVPDSCVGKPLVGLRYLWHETPCPFKQATLYSGTDSNLPAPPYMKLF